jgi:SAM-dependent methyltransferase
MLLMAAYAHAKKLFLAQFGMRPRYNCLLGDGLTVSGRAVRDGAKTWRALDAVYSFNEGRGDNAFLRMMDTFYMHIRNAQAPRNRLKMAMSGLRFAINDVYGTVVPAGEPVRILSLAAGSALGVITVMREMQERGVPSESFLIDLDPEALSYAKRLAAEFGVTGKIIVAQGDVLHFEKMIGDFKPDIIEMMGLTDYLRSKMAVLLFAKIRKQLKSGGYFFTSNVHPNSERYFLKHVVNWDMYYRTVDQLAELFHDAGFIDPKVVTEPHGIQSFAYAKKI